MNKLFNEYNIKARVFPAIISVVPFSILKYFFIDKYFNIPLNQIIFGDISLAIVLIYLLTQLDRFVSKTFFETKSDFPTDRILMPSGKEISDEYRKNITDKIKQDFNLSLPNLSDENSDIENTKIRIREIVRAIITKVRKGNLSLQHNFEYGFVRNLIGGCTIASIVSILNIFLFKVVFPNQKIFITSIIILFIYLIPVIFSRVIVRQYDEEYAHVLFREYLQSDKNKDMSI